MTIGRPTVSVLIACFNAQEYITQTLESICIQSVPADEVVVVDDGSTDGSVAEIVRYENRGVQLIRQENRGASSARNRAFTASTGKFVIFVDADDIIGPRHIESLVARLTESDRSIALSKWGRFYENPEEASFPDRPTERDLPGVDWLLLDWELCRPMTQSAMLLVPRILIEENGGWNENLSLIDDFEFFARIISRSDGVRFAPGAQLYYRSGRRGSLSSQRTRKAVESAFHSIMLGTQHVLDTEFTTRTRRASANILQNFVYTYYPDHADLCLQVRRRINQLGGSDVVAVGPPGFEKLRPLIGWKLARRAQILAERIGLNKVGRRYHRTLDSK